MKKYWLIMIGLVVFAMMLAGCGGSSSSSSNTTPHTHASSEGMEDKIIEFISYIRDSKAQEIKNLLDSQSFSYVKTENSKEVQLKDYNALTNDLVELNKLMTDWEKEKYKFNLEIVKSDYDNGELVWRDTSGLGDGPQYYDINYKAFIKITETVDGATYIPPTNTNSQEKNEGLMTITMRNYNNQSQWVVSKISITYYLYHSNSLGFGLHAYQGKQGN